LSSEFVTVLEKFGSVVAETNISDAAALK